jgi:DNA gyrase/topoisomerase IV subunit B
MYIGNTETPNHLLQEVLDNAIDEAINKFATKISINIDNSRNLVSVCDNGRGFPVHDVKLPNGKIADSVIAATCELFSGSKFDDRSYDFSIGTHGVGLTAINALSKRMSMCIKKDNKIHFYKFESAIFQSKTLHDIEKNIWWSTKVDFEFDEKYFESNVISTEKIIKELLYITSKYTNVDISFNNKILKKVNIDDYFRAIFKVKAETPVYNISYTDIDNAENLFIYFTYDADSPVKEPLGSVNLKFCNGTFLTSFATVYFNLVKNEFLNYDFITRTDILNNFKFFIDIQIKNPKYSSQDKTKMTSNISHLVDKIKSKLLFKLNDDFFKNIFKEIEDEKSNKKLSKLIKNTTGRRVSSENPLKDCKNIPGDILYLLEGDSAEGTLKSIRNSLTEAILPVNGKVINTLTNTKEKILNQKGKFRFLLESLGVNIEHNNLNKKDYRYKLVKIICDADPDGLHISVLLVLGIWKFAPDLIAQKRVSIILPPLYGAVKNNKFIPLYNRNDIARYQDTGYNIKRFKGLGEMNPSELRQVIRDPIEYVIESPKNDDEISFIEMLVTDTSLKKKICLNNVFGFERLFSLINKETCNV